MIFVGTSKEHMWWRNIQLYVSVYVKNIILQNANVATTLRMELRERSAADMADPALEEILQRWTKVMVWVSICQMILVAFPHVRISQVILVLSSSCNNPLFSIVFCHTPDERRRQRVRRHHRYA